MLEKAYYLLMLIEQATKVGPRYAWLVSMAEAELLRMKGDIENPPPMPKPLGKTTPIFPDKPATVPTNPQTDHAPVEPEPRRI